MLSKQLKSQRTKAKLTQVELAAASGVPQTTISGIESGKTKKPSHEAIVSLSQVLGKRLKRDKWAIMAVLEN